MTKIKLLRTNWARMTSSGTALFNHVFRPDTDAVLGHALQVYRHLLPVEQTVSLVEFANIIAQNYDENVPQVGEAIQILRNNYPPMYYTTDPIDDAQATAKEIERLLKEQRERTQ